MPISEIGQIGANLTGPTGPRGPPGQRGPAGGNGPSGNTPTLTITHYLLI